MNNAGLSMVHSSVTGARSPAAGLLFLTTETTAVSGPGQLDPGVRTGDGCRIHQVAKRFMIRLWNEAYSRDDVVNDLALVPTGHRADGPVLR